MADGNNWPTETQIRDTIQYTVSPSLECLKEKYRKVLELVVKVGRR
jgi:hypothetical protein